MTSAMVHQSAMDGAISHLVARYNPKKGNRVGWLMMSSVSYTHLGICRPLEQKLTDGQAEQHRGEGRAVQECSRMVSHKSSPKFATLITAEPTLIHKSSSSSSPRDRLQAPATYRQAYSFHRPCQ